MELNKTCPKCAAPMDEGYQLDSDYATKRVATWISGRPKTSIWGYLTLKGRAQYAIRTFRCTRCGLLESYAGI